MEERAPRQGVGRLLLKALAIMSALAFLAIVMVNACTHYLTPTKAAPVVSPREPVTATPASPRTPGDDEATAERPMNRLSKSEMMAPATKSGAVVRPRPLMNLPPEETPQGKGAPQKQPAPQPRGSR